MDPERYCNMIWSLIGDNYLLRSASASWSTVGSWSWSGLHLPVSRSIPLAAFSGSGATFLFFHLGPGLLTALASWLASGFLLPLDAVPGSWAAPGSALLPAVRAGPSTSASGSCSGLGSWSWTASASFLLPAVIHNLDSTSVQFRIIQFINSILNIFISGKLYNTFIFARLVSVSVGDFPGTSHEVLEVLPGHSRRQVLHNNPVLSTSRRSVLVQPDGTSTVSATTSSTPVTATTSWSSSPTSSSTSPPVLVSTMRSSFSQLASYTVSKKICSMQVIDSVIRVTVVLKLNKRVPDNTKWESKVFW